MFNLLHGLVRHFVHVDAGIVAGSWITGFGGAVAHYIWQHKTEDKSIKGFFKFAFPKELWKHASCRRDYVFMVLNHIIESFTIAPLLIGIVGMSIATYSAMSFVFGQVNHPTNIYWPVWLALLLVMVLIQDFATWLTHFVEHQVPIMWKLHAVHHSAEFLTPISNRRHHPLQLVWEGGVSNVLSGAFIGVASYLLNVNVVCNLFMGVDAYYLASVLSFYQLRHSHIPLHYGWFDRWFLSPAAHQLHHSVEKPDWDKNYGLLTSIWDRLFNTYNPVRPGYTFNIGLEPHEQKQFQTVSSFWIKPLFDIGHIIQDKIVEKFHPKPIDSSLTLVKPQSE